MCTDCVYSVHKVFRLVSSFMRFTHEIVSITAKIHFPGIASSLE